MRRAPRTVAGALALLWAAGLPSPAAAHLVGVEFGDFYAGALHLILAPEPIAALVAIALYAALQPRDRARWMLAGLPAGLTLGAVLPWIAGPVDLAAVDPAIAATLAVTGLAGVAALRAPPWALGLLAGAVGVVHGLSNGLSALDTTVDPMLYTAGVVAAGTVLGTLAIAVASVAVDLADWLRLASRVLSSWVGAVGAVLLGLAVAG